jgi:hypothetical protein
MPGYSSDREESPLRLQERAAEILGLVPPKQMRAALARDAALRWSVFRRDGYQCRKCGGGIDLTIDHIEPISRGGTNAERNLQTLCRRCNSQKGTSIEHHSVPSPPGHAAQPSNGQRRERAVQRRANLEKAAKEVEAALRGEEANHALYVSDLLELRSGASPKKRLAASSRLERFQREHRARGLLTPTPQELAAKIARHREEWAQERARAFRDLEALERQEAISS